MNKHIYILFLFICVLYGTGCGTTPHRIDPTGNQGLTTTHELNFKDWQIAAEKAINSLLESGVLKRNDGRKTVLMISTVKNNTLQHINTRILTDKIRQAILRSGQAVTTTAVSAQGAEDAATRQVHELRNDPMFNKKTIKKMGKVIAPDMSLAGEITQDPTKRGREEESYFFIHLTLTDLNTGVAVWEDNVEIVKQSTKPLFGY